MNVILIGYRGCGKTSIGKELAKKLWSDYFDVDVETCKRFKNDSIADIWQKHGEPAWRAAEAEVTRDLCAKTKVVIGLGGGTLMVDAAREVVKAAPAVRIYLKCAPEELHRRITADQQSAKTRPSLTKHGGSLEEIKEVLAVREPVYTAVADKVLDVTRLTIKDAIRHLIERCL